MRKADDGWEMEVTLMEMKVMMDGGKEGINIMNKRCK